VKRILQIFLMLLAGYAYLASTMEMDRSECKKNYDSEQQYKIAALDADHGALPVSLPFDLPVFFRVCFAVSPTMTTSGIASLRVIPFPEPPDRLFIRYSLLLI